MESVGARTWSPPSAELIYVGRGLFEANCFKLNPDKLKPKTAIAKADFGVLTELLTGRFGAVFR